MVVFLWLLSIFPRDFPRDFPRELLQAGALLRLPALVQLSTQGTGAD